MDVEKERPTDLRWRSYLQAKMPPTAVSLSSFKGGAALLSTTAPICALSAGQLGKPYSRAITHCASLSLISVAASAPGVTCAKRGWLERSRATATPSPA